MDCWWLARLRSDANLFTLLSLDRWNRYTSAMEVITLQSGSAGNCVFVRSGETRLLFDAGISGSNAEMRLAEYGYEIRDCNALVLSHEHSDHISGVGVFHRKFGLPVYANLRTWNATRTKPSTGCIGSPQHLKDRISENRGHLSNKRFDRLKTV